MAALARLQREDPISNEDLEQARQHFTQSWKTFTIAEVSQPLVEAAGRFWPRWRALMTFGNPFGLALHDKRQRPSPARPSRLRSTICGCSRPPFQIGQTSSRSTSGSLYLSTAPSQSGSSSLICCFSEANSSGLIRPRSAMKP